MKPDVAIVALGSNLGDSQDLLLQAFGELRRLGSARFDASSIWRSVPVDCPPDSPEFLNAVCAFEPAPSETPESLLARLQILERGFGRRPKRVHNEPRPLDLDLIAFRSEVRSGADLTLPHPRAHLRRFVLQPLHEIGPDWVLPGWSGTVSEVLRALPVEPNPPRITAPRRR